MRRIGPNWKPASGGAAETPFRRKGETAFANGGFVPDALRRCFVFWVALFSGWLVLIFNF